MYRIGLGYDVHPFCEERKLILGGVELPHSRGLLGHSDADVLTHAIIDALLGASGQRDIGTLFPDTEKKYKAISSLVLLEKTTRAIADRYAIVNIDTVLIMEKPKLGAYMDRMSEKLTKALGVSKDRLNLKATTTEKLGFTGREEGVAAQAVALLQKV